MRHHVINGKSVPFTAEEETAQDIVDAAAMAGAPMREWKADMAALDEKPRAIDDILAYILEGTAIPANVVSRYNVKKSRRTQKP